MKEKKQKQFGIIRLVLMLLAFALASSQVFAQREVTGTVKNASGEPEGSAQVRVPGTDVGTMTDFDGNYTLTVPEGATTLQIVPMSGVQVTVDITGARVDVNLTQNSVTDLDELVVIGYGAVARRDVVTSVSSVSAEQLTRRPVTSAVEAMAGQMAGVNVVSEDGSPDAQLSVRVRGGASLTQSADPLYIVDGIQVSNINDISPTDIKSIDVLKDAASTAIYGAQGANGVVIVTTKDVGNKGDKFSWNVDYSGFVGWKKQAKKWDMMSVEEFIRLRNEYGVLSGDQGGNFGKYFDPVRLSSDYTDNKYNTGGIAHSLDYILDWWKDKPSTDWQNETFGRTGLNSNHSVTAAVGNKNMNFRLSYNRIDDKGIMYNSNYVRNNLNLRANFKPIKDLSITLQGKYVNTEVLGAGTNTDRLNEGSRTESRVRNAIAYTPITLLSDPETDDSFAQEGGMFNPILTIKDNYKLRKDNRYVGSVDASYKFLEKFTATTAWSYDALDRQEDRYYGPTSFWTRSGKEGSVAGALLDADGNAIVGTGKPSTVIRDEESVSFQNTNTLTYKNTFGGGHNLTVMAGHEMLYRTNKWTTTSRIGFLGGDYGAKYTLNNAESLPFLYFLDDITIHDPNDNMLSFFGRADYDYYGRYYVALAMRADASTRFTPDNRWGYFPSAAVAWRMSAEPWFEDFARTAKISDLKWRFSYGVAGNNNLPLDVLYNNYYPRKVVQSMPVFDEKGTPIDEENRVVTVYANDPRIIPNGRNLKWETTITRNLGLDYGFFRGRLSGMIDVYWNSTRDLIIERSGTGDKRIFENMGETEIKGFEFSTKAIILDKRAKEFNYSLTFDGNIGINKSKVVSLGGNSPYNSSTEFVNAGYLANYEFRFEEGLGLGRLWGYRYDGYYTAADFNGYNTETNQWLLNGSAVDSPLAPALGTSSTNPYSGARPGMMKLKDINGDGVIDANDMCQIGNTMPWAAGGFAISGSIGGEKWGAIDVNASFTYSIGNDVLNLTGLDLSTVNPGITSSAALRNNLASVNYGNRYSLFNADGTYIPEKGLAGMGYDIIDKLIQGDAYQELANDLAMSNAGATTYNPIHSRMAITDNAVEDGSFLRLTALTVGYTLPNAWLKKARINRARVFFSASNLWIWTNYTGNDPDVNSAANRNPLNQGVDWSPYPKARAFNFGINLSFN